VGVDEAAETFDAGVVKCSMEAAESSRSIVMRARFDVSCKSLWDLRGMGIKAEDTAVLAPGSDDVGVWWWSGMGIDAEAMTL
jgi:hypothetical protein